QRGGDEHAGVSEGLLLPAESADVQGQRVQSVVSPQLPMPVTLTQVEDARRNIRDAAIRTPLVPLNADAAAQVHLKLENLQPIGSFKIRGAANVMGRTPRERLERGVLTASAGNMAQGVAFCARRLGIPATIVSPDTAPQTKIRAVERLGGRVI